MGSEQRLLRITDQYQADPLLAEFRGKGLINTDLIDSREKLFALFHHADFIKAVSEADAVYEPLKGQQLAVIFYQPSTRTYFSFLAAGMSLGARVIAEHGMEHFSSVVKGEDLSDTIISVQRTTQAKAIVLRHPEDNSSDIAQASIDQPIFNAGSGKRHHPSQALLDMYTTEKKVGLDNIHVVMVGDLLNGRTIKSFSELLAVAGRNVTITMVSAPELRMPAEIVAQLRQKSVNIIETDDFESAVASADVIYLTRVQEEWFKAAGKMDQYAELRDRYILTPELAQLAKPDAIFHHPLPRKEEAPKPLDKDPRTMWFDAMTFGFFIRTALLDASLNDNPGQVPE